MSIPPEIRELIGEIPETEEFPLGDYIHKLPPLDPREFPDEMTIWRLRRGAKLLQILHESGLTKGQRVGVDRILRNAERIGSFKNNIEVTIGHIRLLTTEELMRLSESFTYGKISRRGVHILKILCGPVSEEKIA